jgi:hypothetical protein
MPQLETGILCEAISDALNPSHGQWNRKFRYAIERLDPEFSITATNLSEDDPGPAFRVRVTVNAGNVSAAGIVNYRRFGARNLSVEVEVE